MEYRRVVEESIRVPWLLSIAALPAHPSALLMSARLTTEQHSAQLATSLLLALLLLLLVPLVTADGAQPSKLPGGEEGRGRGWRLVELEDRCIPCCC